MGKRPALLASLRRTLSGRLTAGQFRKYCWHEYAADEKMTSDDPVGVAFEAILYLFCDTQRFNGCKDGIACVVAFLQEETDREMTVEEGRALNRVLETNPIDDDALWNWLCDVFDP